jgi:itaconyl-CoA hydratase
VTEDFRQRAVLRSKGHLFEDFEIGKTLHHHWGRTITEADTVLFSTLLLHFNPLYFNRDYARDHGHPDIVVNPHLLFNVVLGMSVEDCSEIGGPFLGVQNLVYERPIYPGTTVLARSVTVEKRVSKSDPTTGIVTWETEGVTSEDERLVSFRRSNMVKLRNPGSVSQ